MSLFSLATFGTMCGIHTVQSNDEWDRTVEQYALVEGKTIGDVTQYSGFGLKLDVRDLGVGVNVGGYNHTKEFSEAFASCGVWYAPILVNTQLAWDFMSSLVVHGGSEPVIVAGNKGHIGHLNLLYRRGMQSHVEQNGRFIRTVWDIEVQVQGHGYDEDGMPLHLITITGQVK